MNTSHNSKITRSARVAFAPVFALPASRGPDMRQLGKFKWRTPERATDKLSGLAAGQLRVIQSVRRKAERSAARKSCRQTAEIKEIMMSKRAKFRTPSQLQSPPPATSLLDAMVDGREFESLIQVKKVQLDVVSEMRRAISDIESIRGRPTICYLANVVNSRIKAPISINHEDDLPFSELIASVGMHTLALDIVLVTPGGSGQQVAKFVDKLRPRFEEVSFLLPNIAMSAGTILVMSGDEIVMGPNAYIGPIDPQVPNRDGLYVPAQAILTLIEDIRQRGDALMKKGERPYWTDLQILGQIDGKEIGNAISASEYSISLVQKYLRDYKFRTWSSHSDGRPVSADEKEKRAKEIAQYLCDHSQWKSHSRGITREVAWQECKIKIAHSESQAGLERALRRLWALSYWIFENTPVAKIFVSGTYCILRNDSSMLPQSR